jgi:hypothetical protein
MRSFTTLLLALFCLTTQLAVAQSLLKGSVTEYDTWPMYQRHNSIVPLKCPPRQRLDGSTQQNYQSQVNYQPSRRYNGDVNITTAGLMAGLAKFAFPYHASASESAADDRLSAIGITINPKSCRILTIQPTSDLAGKVQIGDVVVSYNLVDPVKFVTEKRNFGSEDTPITVGVLHTANRMYETLFARRHPVTNFSPEFQRRLLGETPPKGH